MAHVLSNWLPRLLRSHQVVVTSDSKYSAVLGVVCRCLERAAVS